MDYNLCKPIFNISDIETGGSPKKDEKNSWSHNDVLSLLNSYISHHDKYQSPMYNKKNKYEND